MTDDGDAHGASGDDFFRLAMRAFGSVDETTNLRVLDWGCGKGAFVAQLAELGFDAHGCDFATALGPSPVLLPIIESPYRLPYEDGTFDFVMSNNVLEHAQNIEECYRESFRVLKPGGMAMHLFPSKWYLPTEPHIWVPLMNWVWPYRPRWWLAIWALLGVRKVSQAGMAWRTVAALNNAYLRDHCSYVTTRRHGRLSMRVFGNCQWPMRFYIDHSTGGVGRLARRLHLRSLAGVLSRQFRVAFLVQKKTSE